MREETPESRGKLASFVRGLFGNPNCRHSTEQMTQTEEATEEVAEEQPEQLMPELPLKPRVNYRKLKAPMSVEEMTVCMIPQEWFKDVDKIGKIQKLQKLFKDMGEFLEISRKISKEAVDSHRKLPANVPNDFRVMRIQEQMRAVRFRLEIRDFRTKAEMQILQDRLYQLYNEAKVIDPEGTARYERAIDKQMRRAR